VKLLLLWGLAFEGRVSKKIGMNTSSFVLALLVAVGLGGVIYSKQTQLADLRRLVESHRAGTQDLSNELEKIKAELEELRKKNEAYKTESEQLRTMLAEAKTANPAAPADTAAAEKKDGQASFMKGMAKMFTDPEMKKSMRAQQSMGIRMMYGDLLKQLGLTGADADQFIDILTERQMTMAAEAMSAMGGDDPDKAAKIAKLADTTKQYDEQLKAVLGEKYNQFKDYEGSIGDRFMLQQWEGQFSSAGSPLESKQKDQLLGLIRDERAKTPDATLINNANPGQSIEAMRDDENIARMMAGQEQVNQRVLARARDFLNPDQVVTLEKAQKQQLELMKGQINMSKEFLGLKKK
jgi:regulator of replication initiation timing